MGKYDICWTTKSVTSSESMPFGGHSIGGNIWVEQDKIYFYLAQSGWFDENNSMLKAGRFCISVNPDIFNVNFAQCFISDSGTVRITGDNGFCVELWADTSRPAVHVDISGDIPHEITFEYQSWRFADRTVDHLSYELFQCKEVFYYPLADAVFHKDTIIPEKDSLLFYHANIQEDLSFYKEIADQGLSDYCNEMYCPQKNLIMGGKISLKDFEYKGQHHGRYIDTDYQSSVYKACTSHSSITVCLLAEENTTLDTWRNKILLLSDEANKNAEHAHSMSQKWWQNYFDNSYIHIDEQNPYSQAWKIGRNYNLFRFMLGLNSKGKWPTKFNGGLLTFDPGISGDSPWSDDLLQYTPDFRLWGGGSHTIQNQRLLYWPMLKSGDFSAMHQHFDFFLRTLETAKINVKIHQHADGAMYPEQVGTYGLCCGCDNEWDNKTGLPVAQIKYHFSNSLETALMMLDYADFTQSSPSPFFDFINSILQFYNTFYPENDEFGHMIIYPANALESYHVIKNPIDAIAGLQCVLDRLLKLPANAETETHKTFWQSLRTRIPPLPKTTASGKTILAYAQTTSVNHNCELPQLYTVHPYNIYGLGKPDLQLAIDTAQLCAETQEQLTHISWHPTGIQYARLGMIDEAWDFLLRKLGDGPFRFPAFWGPGHDWTPDHNWGGSGMIQLQEMLLQTSENELRLLPCWPLDKDVSFKLHAPYNTVVECVWKDKQLKSLSVYPPYREKDIILPSAH